MFKNKKTQLQRAILEIEKAYPKDDLISSYADFLKVRDYLAYYQFNPNVFHSLIQLANESWNTEKRISRLMLLKRLKEYLQQVITRDYYDRGVKPHFDLKPETRKLIFELFKKTFEEPHFIGERQLEEARKLCNSILMNLALTPIEEEWLASHYHWSELILNRVLRYPVQSDVISNWVKINFKKDPLRSRRAELASWIIDQDASFEIKQDILIEDFEYLNQCDLEVIQQYNAQFENQSLPKRDLTRFQRRKNYYPEEDIFDSGNTYYRKAELHFIQRSYKVRRDISDQYPVTYPNFERMRKEFDTNLSTHHKLTMIWAIAYSRIDNSVKCSLMKKYYCNETFKSMFKVSKKNKNAELLKWMLQQQ